MQTVDNVNDTLNYVRHCDANGSSGTVWCSDPSRTRASSCRRWTPANCRLSDVWPCRISIYCWKSIFSAAPASPNRRFGCSFASVWKREFLLNSKQRTSSAKLTATKKHGLTGWKRTHCINPLLLENGICVRRLDSWWINADRLAPSGITVAK